MAVPVWGKDSPLASRPALDVLLVDVGLAGRAALALIVLADVPVSGLVLRFGDGKREGEIAGLFGDCAVLVLAHLSLLVPLSEARCVGIDSSYYT